MEEQKKESVKELSELVVACMEIGLHAMMHFADGIQASDFPAMMAELQTNAEYREKLVLGYEGLSKVKAEAQDLDALEIVHLTFIPMEYTAKMIMLYKEFKKKQVS